MQKHLLLLSTVALLGMSAAARSLSPTEALGRVSVQPASHSSRSTTSSTVPVLTVGSAESPALYVFNKAGGGWMIVSADDVAAPLVAYSDNGYFDTENMPENLKGWLELCKEEILQASASGAQPYKTVSRASRPEIIPYVETTWDQGSPYNKDCPDIGGLTYTGCVATAMAQVMNYYQWPLKAGENANFDYTTADSKVKLSADFSNYEFAWDKMLDSYTSGKYTSEQADAVAKLMQACGYAVHMRYSTYASGARNEHVGYALATYFGYSQGVHNEFRDCHISSKWEEMVYNNLTESKGPMVYWGGAHCFVCDGYRDGYFHFNWGWSGKSDGYYLLSALAPGMGGIGAGSGDYTTGQGALFGAVPAKNGETSPRQYTFRIDELNQAYQGSIGYNVLGKFINYSPFAVSGEFVYQIYSYDGLTKVMSVPVYSPACKNWGIDINTGNTPIVTQMSGSLSNVPDGIYRLYPAVRVDGVEYRFQCPPSIAGYIEITVNGGKAVTSVIPTPGEMIIEDLSTNGDFFLNAYVKVTGKAVFTAGDLNQSVNLLLIDQNNVICGTTGGGTLNFTQDGKEFEIISDWFTPYKDMTITTGEYTLGIAIIENYQYKTIASCPVTVNGRVPRPSIVTPGVLTVENANAVDPENINISIAVQGKYGILYQDLIFIIKNSAGAKVKETTATMFASAGQTTIVTIKTSLPDAKPGERYFVEVQKERIGGGYEYVSSQANPTWFTIGDKSGIADIEADENAPVEYFNLQGLRVDAESLIPGIYIRRQGTKTTKILVK